jgi:hypothetical protein
MVRIALTADASFAAIFARSKFGMAMAAMIRMIATTISNSMSENPLCLFIKSPTAWASYFAYHQRRYYQIRSTKVAKPPQRASMDVIHNPFLLRLQ